MNALLWTVFLMFCASSLLTAAECGKDHPRVRQPVSAATDAIALVINVGLAVWAGVVLFGGRP